MVYMEKTPFTKSFQIFCCNALDRLLQPENIIGNRNRKEQPVVSVDHTHTARKAQDAFSRTYHERRPPHENFTYSYPTHVYFGKGALANALKAELPAVAK